MAVLTEEQAFDLINQLLQNKYIKPQYNKKIDFFVDGLALFIANYLKEKINGELGIYTDYTYINSVIPYNTNNLQNKDYPVLKVFRLQDTYYHNQGINSNTLYETDFQLQIEMRNLNEKTLYGILTVISRIINKSLINPKIKKIIKLSSDSPLIINYEKSQDERSDNIIVLKSTFKIISNYGKLNNIFPQERIDDEIEEYLKNNPEYDNVQSKQNLDYIKEIYGYV